MGRSWCEVVGEIGRPLGYGALLLAALCSGCSKETSKRAQPTQTRVALAMPDVSALSVEMGMPPERLASGFNFINSLLPLQEIVQLRAGDPPKERLELGHLLFFEPRLSSSGHISCQSCHVLSKYGVDGKRKAIGHEGHVGRRNTSSVFNLGAVSLFFWDGRAHSLEEQARGPLLNTIEMAMTDDAAAVAALKAVPAYQKAFQKAFPQQAGPYHV